MGSTESSEARRVSFGMDEEERVRVLQGIRLSENVVNRMKDPNQPCKAGEPAPPPAPPPSTPSTGGSSKGPEKDSKPPRSEYGGGRQPSGVEEDFLKRYKQEQAKVQDELFQVVTREREAATKHRSASMQRGEGSVDQDKRKSTQLARELESREAELSRRDTFYKEQLGRLERKNAEMYKLSSQQFHEAASKMEGTIKVEEQASILALAVTWSSEEGTSDGTTVRRPLGHSHFLLGAYGCLSAWGCHVFGK
ncbi:MICOS complex subunit MIC25 isoform X3 [Prionailurus viverrinus]|uniref:MICOS complex subunit MIC25 isoform X3 n=1 Tax=Prionailurus viverrinus TaxID=61388 RepID=UPI001FF290D2|nr:MICOS complex subunit MIC25 isoform X3 [Prionailurus viverrinus]